MGVAVASSTPRTAPESTVVQASAPTSNLVRYLRSWLKSPATRRAIQAPANGTVKRLKDELASLSEKTDAFNLNGILTDDVPSLLQDMFTPPWSPEWVGNVTRMLVENSTADWRSWGAARMSATHLMFSTIMWALDRSNGLYPIVTCTLDTEFQGAEVDLVMNTTLNPDGSSNSSSHVAHSALKENDTVRIMVQLESICDGNILQVLQGAPWKKGVLAQPDGSQLRIFV